MGRIQGRVMKRDENEKNESLINYSEAYFSGILM